MKVALICRGFWPNFGGVTLHALRLAQHMQKQGHQVEGITRFVRHRYSEQSFYSETEPQGWYETEGVHAYVMGLSAWDRFLLRPIRRLWWKPSRIMWAVRIVSAVMTPKFVRIFNKQRYDVIHFDGVGRELWGFAALKAARRLHIPFVVQPSLHIGEWGVSECDYRFFRLADALLVHSEAEKDYLLQHSAVSADRIHVVYNGIDEVRGGDRERFRQEYRVEGPMVLFIGRKSLDKGYFLLHQAFHLVVQKIPSAKLVMLGPARTDFREKVDENATWVQEIDDASESKKRDALAACDVFCLPSRGESFGLGCMEAALCGKPSVVRNIPVLDSLLGCHNGALLAGVRKEDGTADLSPEDLAETMLLLLDNPARCQEMGAQARKQAERFLWPRTVGRFESVYRLLLAGNIRSNPDTF